MCLIGKGKKAVKVTEEDNLLSYRAWSLGWEFFNGEADKVNLNKMGLYSISANVTEKWSKKMKIEDAPDNDLYSNNSNIGFHSLKNIKKAFSLRGTVGIVRNTGMVVEHANGYRAQAVEILALTFKKVYVQDQGHYNQKGIKVVKHLAKKLGVQYVDAQKLAELMKSLKGKKAKRKVKV